MSAMSGTSVDRGLEAIIDAAAEVLAEKSLDATMHGMSRALDSIVPFTSLALYEAEMDMEGDLLSYRRLRRYRRGRGDSSEAS